MMKAKTKPASLLSLRCKFKDTKTVEVTVMDSSTNETWAVRWQFRDNIVTKEGEENAN